MRNWKALALACVIFVSGVVAGVAGTRLYVRRAVLGVVAGDMGRVEGMILDRLDEKLDLSQEQRRELRPVLDGALGEMAAIRRESRPRVDAAIDRAVAGMKRHLSPEQGRTLDDMAARFRAARDEGAARNAAGGASRE